MAKLIYSAITSLDGYVADEHGNFDWGVPDEEVHRFVNDMERPIGTYLYGRRMYEVMAAWEREETVEGQGEFVHDFATVWRAAEKVVYSTTLDAVETTRTRVERAFKPAAVQQLKDGADRDLSVGGPNLAAAALRAGLVDELRMLLAPVVVGGGNQALPDDVRMTLDLIDERRFDNGFVHLQYRVS